MLGQIEIEQNELERIVIDGQVLYCPTLEQWEEIFKNRSFSGVSLGSRDVVELIQGKVLRNSKYPDIKSCIATYNKWAMLYELLWLGNEYYRVFIESIVCDYCGHRAEISATPTVSDIYIGVDNEQRVKAIERARRLPNLSCPHCGKTYDRRYTIWQMTNDNLP